MYRKFFIGLIATITLFFTGCRDNLSPLSPKLRQDIQNQQGRINELETLNNALKLELSGVKNQLEIHARDIQNMQTGVGNKHNSGVQILQGDGAMIVILILGLGVIALVGGIYYYRNKTIKTEEAAKILAQELALTSDTVSRICDQTVQKNVVDEMLKVYS